MKRSLIILVFVLLRIELFGQDPQFTQFYSNPLYMAPSYAGGVAGHRLIGNYRNQRSVVPGTFQTFGLTYDHNFVNFRSGLGLLLYRDIAGDGKLGNTLAGILYSFDFEPVSNLHIRPGLGFYYTQISIDFSSLVFGDQLTSDPRPPSSIQPPGNTAVGDIDVSSSILVFSDNFWVGGTWDHMLQPDRSFYNNETRTPFKFSLYGGYRFITRGFLISRIEESVTVAFNFKKQDLASQLDLGLYWYRQPMMFGVWYRGIPFIKDYPGSDALSFLVGYRHQNLSVAYSYDFTVSKLGPASGGSHEISFSWLFNIKVRKRYKSIPCPTF